MLVLGQVFLVDNDFVDVFLEPVVAHDEEAFFTGLVTPRVFHLPLADVAVVFINTDQGHGVGDFPNPGSQAVSLGQAEVNVKEVFQLVEVSVQVAGLAVHLPQDVVAEPNGFPVL